LSDGTSGITLSEKANTFAYSSLLTVTSFEDISLLEFFNTFVLCELHISIIKLSFDDNI